MNIKILITVLLFSSVWACTPNQKKEAKDVKEEVSQLGEVMTDDMRQQWEETKDQAIVYQEKLDRQIDEIDKKMENASNETKQELKEQRKELVEWRDGVEKRINSMGKEVNEDWNIFVRETKEYFKKLDKALDS